MVEDEPAIAERIFGDRIGLARQFTADLAAHGEERGLIGPLEPARIWTRHVLNSAVVGPLLAGTVGDVGTGAGLPGLVLAIARSDVQFVLVEPMERRVAWLAEQVQGLGLENVEIVRGRAEDWTRGPVLDVVTARAVSALRTLVPLVAPMVRDGGELVLFKGANAAVEIDAASKQLAKAGVRNARVEVLGEGMLVDPTRVVRGTVRRGS